MQDFCHQIACCNVYKYINHPGFSLYIPDIPLIFISKHTMEILPIFNSVNWANLFLVTLISDMLYDIFSMTELRRIYRVEVILFVFRFDIIHKRTHIHNIFIHSYINTCIVNTHTYTYIHTSIPASIHNTYIHVYTHTYLHTYISTYVLTYLLTHVHTHQSV